MKSRVLFLFCTIFGQLVSKICHTFALEMIESKLYFENFRYSKHSGVGEAKNGLEKKSKVFYILQLVRIRASARENSVF